MIDIEASIAELREIWGQGAGIHKRSDDLARYDILFERIKPGVVVELGLYYGGSALHFAPRVPWIINVELNHQTTEDYRNNVHGLGFPPDNGIIIEGHSHEMYEEVAARARELAGDKPIMVICDSDHGTDCVYGELIRYCDLVTSGSYMVCEDTLLHYLPQNPQGGFEGRDTPHNWFIGNPKLALDRFLSEQGGKWVVDQEIEDLFPRSQHPGGWLRKL